MLNAARCGGIDLGEPGIHRSDAVKAAEVCEQGVVDRIIPRDLPSFADPTLFLLSLHND